MHPQAPPIPGFDYIPPAPPAPPAPAPAPDPAAQAAQAQAAAQAQLQQARVDAGLPPSEATAEQQAKLLASLGRPGWKVIGMTAHMVNQSVRDPVTNQVTNQLQPDGSENWVISGPNGLSDTIRVRPGPTPEADYQPETNPKDLTQTQLGNQTVTVGPGQTVYGQDPNNPTGPLVPKATGGPSTQTQTVGGVVYAPDPNNPGGPWIPKTPGADVLSQTQISQARADVTKTLVDSGYTQAQANALIQKTPAEVQQALAAAGASQAQATAVLGNLAIAQAKLPGEQAAQAASTQEAIARAGQAAAQTGQIQSAVEIAQAKLPGELAQAAATTAGTQATAARTQQQIAQGNAPTLEANVGTGPYIYSRDPNTGALTPQVNQNFIPKTQADVSARVGQLQSMAQQQRDQLSQQVAQGVLTPDKAASQFDQWWQQNVEPQKATLQAAQATAQQEQQRLQQEQARANLATAQAAGQTAVSAQQAMMPYAVGLGFKDTVNQLASSWSNLKAPMPNLDIGNAVSFKAPNVTDTYNQAVAQALQHISPTAAAVANGPGATPTLLQQPPDINQMLNMNAPQYQFAGPGGAQPMPMPANAPPPVMTPMPFTGGPANPINLSASPVTPTGTGFTSYPNLVDPTQMPGYNPGQYAPSF